MSVFSILFGIFLFSLLIFIHELGHFAAAKTFGVQVNEFSMFMGPVQAPFTKQPIPDNVPPATAEAAPRIDVHAPGRTADQLAQWAQPIAEATRIPSAAVRAYGNAEVIAARGVAVIEIVKLFYYAV